jgi:hypothetical protein
MTSLHTGILEPYIKKRINNWFVVYGTNTIYGEIIPWNLESYVAMHAYIIAFIDNYVLIRIGSIQYALVLGNVEPSRIAHKFEYIDYLKKIVPPPTLVI